MTERASEPVHFLDLDTGRIECNDRHLLEVGPMRVTYYPGEETCTKCRTKRETRAARLRGIRV